MSGRHSIGAWILDAVVWVVVGYFTYTQTGSSANGRGYTLNVALAAFFFIPFGLVWIPFRLGARILALSKRAGRMELATTPIDVNRYLSKRILGIALRAAGPAIMAAYIAAAYEYWERPAEDISFEVAEAFLVIVWTAVLIFMGCVDWLRRLCRRSHDSLLIHAPIFWIVISVGVPQLTLAYLGLVPMMSRTVPFLMALTLALLIRNWKNLCREYLVMEARAERIPAPTGVSQ